MEKYSLIRRFAKERIEDQKKKNSDFAFQATISGLDEIDSWNIEMLDGLPESTIVTIVEAYLGFKNQGLDEFIIFENIENHRSSFDPYPNPEPMPSDPNIKNYIYYRLKFELPTDAGYNIGENGVTRDFIERMIKEALEMYGL